MSKIRRPVDTNLTVLEINRWVFAPRKGLDDLLALGKIDVEAIRQLNTLAKVVARVSAQVPDTLDSSILTVMTRKMEQGEAVDEEEIEAAQRWLEACAGWLRTVRRLDFQHALNGLIAELEVAHQSDRK